MAHYPVPGAGAPPAGKARRQPLAKAKPVNAVPSACLIAAPSFQLDVPVVGSIGPSLGGMCLFSKTEARAVMGTLIITAGGLVLFVGTLWLAAWGVKRSGVADKAANAVGAVPGGKGVAAGIRTASRAIP